MADSCATAPDATLAFELAAVEVEGATPTNAAICLRLRRTSSGKSAISEVLAVNTPDAMSEAAARALYRQKVIEFDGVIKKHSGRTTLL